MVNHVLSKHKALDLIISMKEKRGEKERREKEGEGKDRRKNGRRENRRRNRKMIKPR